MKKLLWITDPHLDHISGSHYIQFLENLKELDHDYLLLGGDLGSSRSILTYLDDIRNAFQGIILGVLGNHDFYFSGISALREKIQANVSPVVCPIFEPSFDHKPWHVEGSTYLVATGGWGDAFPTLANLELNDERFINELTKKGLEKTLQNLGREHASYFQLQLEHIPKKAKNLIVLSHVPVFSEACRFGPNPSEACGLARFHCKALELQLNAFLMDRPNLKVISLCGHTHEGWYFKHGNIECHTGHSIYGRLHHSAELILDKDEIRVDRKDGIINSDGVFISKI